MLGHFKRFYPGVTYTLYIPDSQATREYGIAGHTLPVTFLAEDLVQVKDADKQLHLIPATSVGLQKDALGWWGHRAA
jgi:hypothetical protein